MNQADYEAIVLDIVYALLTNDVAKATAYQLLKNQLDLNNATSQEVAECKCWESVCSESAHDNLALGEVWANEAQFLEHPLYREDDEPTLIITPSELKAGLFPTDAVCRCLHCQTLYRFGNKIP